MPIHELIICCALYHLQQTSATPQRAPEVSSVQCIGIKTNIKLRHDVMYVDKSTYCIHYSRHIFVEPMVVCHVA